MTENTRPVVGWLLDTFSPINPDDPLDSDRYAVVEDGVDRCFVRFFDKLDHVAEVLTEDLREGYGIGGRIRVFDLDAPVDACELDCQSRIALLVDGTPRKPDPEPARSSAPEVLVICTRDPDYSNDFAVFADGRVHIVDVDLGRSVLDDHHERAEWRDGHMHTVAELEKVGHRAGADALRAIIDQHVSEESVLRDELRDLEGEGQFRGIPHGYVDSLTIEQVRERLQELREPDERD